MPPTAASEQPTAQLSMAIRSGSGAVEDGERAVVDVGPHRDADAGAVQQEAQPERDDDRRPDRDRLVVGDGGDAEVDAVALEEALHRTAPARLPDRGWPGRSCPMSRLIETTSFVASLVPTSPRKITPLEEDAEQRARARAAPRAPRPASASPSRSGAAST